MLILITSALQMRMDKRYGSVQNAEIHLFCFCPFAFVTRRIEYKHLRCAQNNTYYELNMSFFQLFPLLMQVQ